MESKRLEPDWSRKNNSFRFNVFNLNSVRSYGIRQLKR